MEYNTVKVTRDGPVVTVTLNRPDKLNAFDQEMRKELADALASSRDDPSVRALVLGGEGRAFCAGADLGAGWRSGDQVEMQLMLEYKPSFVAIEGAQVPVIAAINGSASGIGMSLALHCDLVVMAENSFLLSPFANIGLVPDGGATFSLVKQVGYHRAYQLAIECERLPAEKALELGLVNKLAPPGEATQVAEEWAQALAQRAPKALHATKRAARRAMHGNFDEVYAYEATLQGKCIDSKDYREGVDAFMNKRKPNFTGE